MTTRKQGKILCQHEERLIEAGLDPDEAAALVDELEEELDALEMENAADDQDTIDDRQTEDVTPADDV